MVADVPKMVRKRNGIPAEMFREFQEYATEDAEHDERFTEHHPPEVEPPRVTARPEPLDLEEDVTVIFRAERLDGGERHVERMSKRNLEERGVVLVLLVDGLALAQGGAAATVVDARHHFLEDVAADARYISDNGHPADLDNGLGTDGLEDLTDLGHGATTQFLVGIEVEYPVVRRRIALPQAHLRKILHPDALLLRVVLPENPGPVPFGDDDGVVFAVRIMHQHFTEGREVLEAPFDGPSTVAGEDQDGAGNGLWWKH